MILSFIILFIECTYDFRVTNNVQQIYVENLTYEDTVRISCKSFCYLLLNQYKHCMIKLQFVSDLGNVLYEEEKSDLNITNPFYNFGNTNANITITAKNNTTFECHVFTRTEQCQNRIYASNIGYDSLYINRNDFNSMDSICIFMAPSNPFTSQINANFITMNNEYLMIYYEDNIEEINTQISNFFINSSYNSTYFEVFLSQGSSSGKILKTDKEIYIDKNVKRKKRNEKMDNIVVDFHVYSPGNNITPTLRFSGFLDPNLRVLSDPLSIFNITGYYILIALGAFVLIVFIIWIIKQCKTNNKFISIHGIWKKPKEFSNSYNNNSNTETSQANHLENEITDDDHKESSQSLSTISNNADDVDTSVDDFYSVDYIETDVPSFFYTYHE